MGIHKVAILLVWLFFTSCAKLDLKVEAIPSSPLEKEIKAKLKLLNKPAVKTIKSEDGDIIDCVDMYKQPAFDHPLLRNHTIQRIPSFLQNSHKEFEVLQPWQKSGSCPEGTIPTRRIRKEDLLRASSLDRFGQKPPELFLRSTNSTNLKQIGTDAIYSLNNRSEALLMSYGLNSIGAEADVNVWNPKIEMPEDFTTAQLWFKAVNNFHFESVEAGWMVNPKLYGDNRTRLFAAWTKDSYKLTGCFDLTCPGFVQVSQKVTLGAAIEPVSTGSEHYDINVGIFWDKTVWWLRVGKTPVGYWPTSLVESLKNSATIVQWGGQVYSEKVKRSPHTGTAMGSGYFPGDRYENVCYMRNVRIMDYSRFLKYPQLVTTDAAEPDCYAAFNDYHDIRFYPEPVFYFGGPGRNLPHCP